MANTTDEAAASGTLVSWSEGIGDERRYHIAHVSPEGITLVLKMKDDATWKERIAAASSSPDEAAAMLQKLPNAVCVAPGDISRVTYTQKLRQLTLFDQNEKKTKLPEGQEQAEVYAAIKQHLGGSEREEEADAWSVMKSPLFTLGVIGTIGGFFIWFTTICDPSHVATGRRSGMKNLLNTLGYKIGPMWMSIIVGGLAAIVLFSMVSQLIKRPIRQVLQYAN